MKPTGMNLIFSEFTTWSGKILEIFKIHLDMIWAIGSMWPCLSRDIELDHLQRSLSRSTILWYQILQAKSKNQRISIIIIIDIA